MPKAKYLYKNKKSRYKGQNQEGLDEIFFKSPKYAQIVAKKYGIHVADVERSLNKYFECLKEMGLTQLINKDKTRTYISQLSIDLSDELGGTTAAFTRPLNKMMAFRKSVKAGEFSTLFHEFNHFLSIGKDVWRNNSFDFRSSTGFQHMTYFDDGFRGFNEGTTEYLARLQKSYFTKQPAVIEAYSFWTAYARQLYFIAGNELYEDYFNGGSFEIVGRKLEGFGIGKEELLALADDVSLLLHLQGEVFQDGKIQSGNLIDFVNINYEVQSNLISMFERKINNDAFKNLNKFNSFDEITDTMFNAYLTYAKALYFGCSSKSMNNYNRIDIFGNLVNSFLDNLEDIANFITENPEEVNFEFDGVGVDDEAVEHLKQQLEKVNDRNYALVEFGEEEITLEKMKDKEIRVYNEGYANYLRSRRKYKYSKTRDMKDERYLEEEYLKHGSKALYELKQSERYVEEEPEMDFQIIIIQDDEQQQ